jgi:hypothetical protein
MSHRQLSQTSYIHRPIGFVHLVGFCNYGISLARLAFLSVSLAQNIIQLRDRS